MLPGTNSALDWLTHASIYQEYLAKTLTDKYSTLNGQMDKVINDANSELNILNQKLSSMALPLSRYLLADLLSRYANRSGQAQGREHGSCCSIP